MKISIICPLYNAEKYIVNLDESIKNQNVNDIEVDVHYVLTRCNDKTEEILKSKGSIYTIVEKEEFSHSLTRENIGLKVDGDIIVFISQDINPKNNDWLLNLVSPIIEGECEASFSRQICTNNSIEKYTRECNYPSKSRIVSKKDIPQYGLLTFFYSDASSAINSKVYKELNAYDGKKLIINEDMYLAHKIIMNGYRIKYCANSEIDHSHTFTLKQLFDRYYDTGKFFAQNKYFSKYPANESGFKLAKYVFKRSLQEKNFKVMIRILPDFGIRYIGKYLGEKSKK